MLAICRNNDQRYDGLFYMTVSSTGIYCLPSCTARFPNLENIGFVTTRAEAEAAGFRGCLRCHAAELQFQPPWLTDVVDFLHNHLEQKITMTDLEQLTDRHRSTISQHFLAQYGTTPLTYLRDLRLEAARSRIAQGQDYREVAFTLGYSSVSGFRSAFKTYFDTTPGQIREVSS